MIEYPSPKFFRQMLLFGFIVWIAMLVIEYFAYDVNTLDEAAVLAWNYYGAKLSSGSIMVLYWTQCILYGIGLIAMICLRGWGRMLILTSLIIDFVTTTFLGLIVYTGSMDMLGILVDVLVGVPFVLSFFEPCSGYFRRANITAEQVVAPDG